MKLQSIKPYIYVSLYAFGLLIIFLFGEFFIDYVLGYALSLLGFFYFCYYFYKNDLKNQYLKNFFFISLLFFWIRIPFILKTPIYPDFDYFYIRAVFLLLDKLPFIYAAPDYGPTFYLFLFTASFITNGDYYGIKFFFVIIDFLNLIMIYLISSHLNHKNKEKYVLLYTLMPFLIVEFAWNGHNDIGAVLLVLISVYFLLKNHNLLSTLFLLSAITYKFYPFILYPLYLIYYYKKLNREGLSKKEMRKKFFFFISPILIIAVIVFIVYPAIIHSLIIAFQSQGTRNPISTLRESIFHILYGTDIPTAIGQLLLPDILWIWKIFGSLWPRHPLSPLLHFPMILDWEVPNVRYELDNFMLIISILLGTIYLMWNKIKPKINREILLAVICSLIIGFLLFPKLPNIIWFTLSITILIIILLFDRKNKYVLSSILLITAFYLIKYFVPSIYFFNFTASLNWISIIIFSLLNYYLYWKSENSNDRIFLFSIFSGILTFLLFHAVNFAYYFSWVIPFCILLFNKDKYSRFFVIFMPLYTFINYPALYVLLFDDMASVLTIGIKIFIVQIILISILIIINIKISIDLFKEKFQKFKFIQNYKLFSIIVWILIGISSILILNFSQITSWDIFTRLVEIEDFGIYPFSLFWKLSGYSINVNSILVLIVVFAFLLFGPIIYYSTTFLKNYLQDIQNNQEEQNQKFLENFKPIVIILCIVFFVNSIPLAMSNIYLIFFNLTSMMFLLTLFKNLNNKSLNSKDIKSE